MSDEANRCCRSPGVTNVHEQLRALNDQWCEIQWRFQEYGDLFTAERIPLINAFAGPFMGMVQRLLWDDLLLRIARLSDPERSGKGRNLTIRSVPSFFQDEQKRRLQALVNEATAAATFARDHRNRRIAHADLELLLQDPAAKPLEQADRCRIDEALKKAHAIFDHLAGEHAAAIREIGGPGYSDDLVMQIVRLVTAVQFIDETIDPTGGSTDDKEKAQAFLDNLGLPGLYSTAHGHVVDLRIAARKFPRESNGPLRPSRRRYAEHYSMQDDQWR